MIVFGKWSLWAMIVLVTLGFAGALVTAGNFVVAAALVAVVVAAAIYNLRGPGI